MKRLAISLLGPMRVTIGGNPARFEADTARALLAYLVVHRETPLRRETLAGLLWPDQPERAVLGNLRQALTRVRRAIGDRDADADPPFLMVTRKTVQFNPGSDHWLDVAAFTEAIDASQKHRHRRLEVCRRCMGGLGEALELYRGEFLAGFSLPSSAFEEWLVVQRERLHRQALEGLGNLRVYHERRGEWARAEDYARRELEMEPWREGAQRGLMRALAMRGQRAAALAQYQTCCEVLAEELGVAPEDETTALYEQICDVDGLDALSLMPPHGLPIQPTPFVGRKRVLAEIEERLIDPGCRLLTLLGPGGSGKTRLAVQEGLAQIHAFDHGVFFVNLAPLRSAEAIVPTIAQALGFSFFEGGTPEQQLLDYVRHKSMLLILDNFEHLLTCPEPGRSEGVAWVTDVLGTAPGVSILVTSRTSLNAQGEELFLVEGMDVPDWEQAPTFPEALSEQNFGERSRTAQDPRGVTIADPEEAIHYNAVQLFASSARRVRPDFVLSKDNVRDVVQVCRLVHGLPLGIVLAAGWMGVLTPAQIGEHIRQGLDFLETDLRDVPLRERSIRAVFDHSWKLLTEWEQQVFQALSVFRGGFTQEAAQAVAGATLQVLLALVDRSLLQRTPGGRYEIHELLRQYAAKKLAGSFAASVTAHERHCVYYAAALQAWAFDLKGPRQSAALAEMDVEIDNARVAWDWAVDRAHVTRLDQTIEGLCCFYEWRGRYQEGETACRRAARKLAVTASREGLRLLVKTWAWQSLFGHRLGRTEVASQLLQKSLALLESPELVGEDTQSEQAFILLHMGLMVGGSDYEAARGLYERSLALYRGLSDQWGMADVLSHLSWVATAVPDYDEARRLYEESLALRRSLGDQRGIAHSLLGIGNMALTRGHVEEAERRAQESLAIRQDIGGQARIALGLINLGNITLFLGQPTRARSLLKQSLTLYDDMGYRNGLARANAWLGHAEAHLGHYEQAHIQARKGLALFQEVGDQEGIGHGLFVLGMVALAEEAYAEAQRWLMECAAADRSIRHLPNSMRALAVLGAVARSTGNLPEARRYLCEALRMVDKTRTFVPLMFVLPGIALLLAEEAQVERAVEVYALASRYPFVANSCWFEAVAGKHIAAVAASLPLEVAAAAQERGQGRNLWATAAELLAQLGG